MPHALSLPRVRARRRRPPSFRRLLGLTWLAICPVSLAHAVTEIAAGKYLFVPIAVLWVVLYLQWRRISRTWERLDELDLPVPVWEMRLQLTLVSMQLLATNRPVRRLRSPLHTRAREADCEDAEDRQTEGNLTNETRPSLKPQASEPSEGDLRQVSRSAGTVSPGEATPGGGAVLSPPSRARA